MEPFCVVIPSWNTRDLLLDCLQRLEPLGKAAEVVVVDNGSGDGTAGAVVSAHPWARLLPLPANVGFAGAVNRGWRFAAGDPVIFLNSDTRPDPREIARLAQWLAGADENIGVAGPALRLPDGRLQTGAAGWDPGPGAVACFAFFLGRILPHSCRPFFLRQEAFFAGGAPPVTVDWVSGAAMAVRRKVLEETGGFDERFFMYAEDVEFCFRVRQAGHGVRYLPGIGIVHLHGGAADPGEPVDSRWLEATVRYRRRTAGPSSARLVALVFAVGFVLRWLLAVLGIHGGKDRSLARRRSAAWAAAAARLVCDPGGTGS